MSFAVVPISNVISMTSATGLAEGNVCATILLIFLLSSKEILSACSYWNDKISGIFDAIISPLLIVFFSIVIFKITEIL